MCVWVSIYQHRYLLVNCLYSLLSGPLTFLSCVIKHFSSVSLFIIHILRNFTMSQQQIRYVLKDLTGLFIIFSLWCEYMNFVWLCLLLPFLAQPSSQAHQWWYCWSCWGHLCVPYWPSEDSTPEPETRSTGLQEHVSKPFSQSLPVLALFSPVEITIAMGAHHLVFRAPCSHSVIGSEGWLWCVFSPRRSVHSNING